MRGHIKERSPGRWAVILDVRDPENGTRKRRWHSFAGTKRQAQTECARLISELNGGLAVDPTRETVGAFLERWIDHMRGQVSPRSLERYQELARKNLAPLVGALPIAKLTPARISAAYSNALTSGRRDGTGGLSARTVTHMHRVLRHALKQAVVWQVLARNPADAVRPPKVERAKMNTYDLAQTAELIEATKGNRLHVPVVLAILCGLRRGEISALRWGSVDLDAGRLAVVQSAEQMNGSVRLKEPKSGRARTVALSATVVEELRRHRLEQAQGLLKLGVRLSDENFVAAHADGTMMQPTWITHEWVKFIGGTALPRVRFHDLRHAHGTAMLASGVHVKVASERLGHSKVGITLDLYSHVLPGMQEDAAARMDIALRQAQQTRAGKPKG